MITIKQAEALYWIAKLGSFELAANKLHMSQSAISKRIVELESTFEIKLFERSGRNSVLTEKGLELLDEIKDLLDRKELIIEKLSTKEVLIKNFRFGVTELIALTWLPKLIDIIRSEYPKVQIDVQIESTSKLHRLLTSNQLDLVITPMIRCNENFIVNYLGSVENAWMCSPKLFKTKEPISLQNLTSLPILAQNNKSGTGLIYDEWFKNKAISFSNTIASDSLLAQVGAACSVLGVSYLPKKCFSYLLKSNKLCIIDTIPPLPKIKYAAFFNKNKTYGLNIEVSKLAKEICDFNKFLLASDV